MSDELHDKLGDDMRWEKTELVQRDKQAQSDERIRSRMRSEIRAFFSSPVTAKDGLLWQNGKMLSVYAADTLAGYYSLGSAEQLVRKLEAEQKERNDLQTSKDEAHRILRNVSAKNMELEKDLARVTAERDGYVSDIERFVWNLAGCDTIASGWRNPGDYDKTLALPALDSVSRMASELAALRARVADCEELLTHREHDIERYKQRVAELEAECAELRATCAELVTDGNAITLAANLAKVSQRNAELKEAHAAANRLLKIEKDSNAELVAALCDIHSAAKVDGYTEEAPDMVCKIHALASKALARAESATPAPKQNPKVEDALYKANLNRRFKDDGDWPQVLADEVRRLRAESATPAGGWLDRHAENFKQCISTEGSATPANHSDTVRVEKIRSVYGALLFRYESIGATQEAVCAHNDAVEAIDAAMKGTP